MPDRYFVDTPLADDRALLAGPEAHHLARVMRARPGDEIMLFDGSGLEALARVERVGRSEVELQIVSKAAVDRELPLPVVLGAALPKGDRQRWLVEKAVELGVTELVPLVTTRSVAQPVAGARARLGRAVIEASKQCGRNRLMAVGEPMTWPEYVQTGQSPCRLVAHPGGQVTAADAVRQSCPRGVWLAIGPEGGLTSEEIAQAREAGWAVVDLGPRILRVETAALLLATIAALAVTGTARQP